MIRDVEHELQGHARALRGLARALVGEQHADDLVQDTLVQALEHGERPRAARAWLATVMRFVAHKRRRGERRRAARERLAAAADAAAPPADAGVSAREAFQRVTAAVTALPEPYQTTILLRYLRELAPAEVAAAMRVPLATVKTRLARGLALLRERFDAEQRGRGGDWRAAFAVAFGIDQAVPIGAAAAGGVLMTATAKWVGGTVAAAALAAAWWLGGTAPVAPPGREPAAGSGAVPVAAQLPAAASSGADAANAIAREAVAGAPDATAALATVRGRLVDENGAPLPGLAVELRGTKVEGGLGHDFDGEYSDWIRARGGRRWADQQTISGADGRFAFAAEPSPLSLTVLVRRTPVEHAIGLDQRLREPRTVDLGDLTVPVACTLRCRVVDERGRVVPSPSVALDLPRDEQLRMATTRVFAARLGRLLNLGGGAFAATVVAGAYDLRVRGRRIVSGARVDVPPRTASFAHEVVVAAAPTDDAIGGIVVDERGVPLPDVGVFATRETHSWASTDALGQFLVQRGDQKDGDVQLGFDKAGYEWAPHLLRARWGERDLRVVLRDLVAIDVRAVDDERGEPVTGFAVWLFQTPREPVRGRFGPRQLASGEHEHGVARLDAVERGAYRVVVEPHRRDLWRSDAVEVDAEPGRVVLAEVRLRRAADRTLVVRRTGGAPVPDATVELIDAAAAAPEPVGVGIAVCAIDHWDPLTTPFPRVLLQRGETGSDGALRLYGPAGVAVVARVSGDGFAPFVLGPFRLDDEGELAATVPVGATVVGRVGPPELVRELLAVHEALGDRPRQPGFRLQRGTGANAELLPPATMPAARIDADGAFRIPGAAAGDWQVALDPWDAMPDGELLVWTGASVPLANVALRDGQTTEVALDLAAWLPATITGVVRCNGQPVANAKIGVEVARMHLDHARPRRTLVWARTDGDGRFRYRGRGGSVTVLVDRGNADPLQPRTNWVAAGTTVALPPNGTVERDFDVIACPVRIRLRTASGAPVAGATVMLGTDDGSRVHRFGPTDRDGGAADDVEPATFAVRSGDGKGPVLARVTVVAGAANEFVVDVPDPR